MQLVCPKCHHSWEDSLAADSTMAQCPECFTAFRFTGGATQAASAPTLTQMPLPAPAAVPPGAPLASQPISPAAPASGDLLDSNRSLAELPTYVETMVEKKGADVGPYSEAHSDSKKGTTGFTDTVMDVQTQTMEPVRGGTSRQPAAPPPRAVSAEESIDDLFDGDSEGPRPYMAPNARTDTPTVMLPEWDTEAVEQDVTAEQFPANTAAQPTRPSPSKSGSSGSVDSIDSAKATGGRTKSFHATSPKEMDLTGESISGYRVIKMLGAGGMGAVCLARQLSLDRDVALKILPGTFAQNPEFLVRFTREALSAAQLTHHNIIQVYDVGSDNQYHYIAMEFVRGDNLGTMVKKEGRLRYEDACGFVLQAARGLKFAHEHSIIHRDIKPDNIMVNDNGIVKIADMGLAKFRNAAEKAGPRFDDQHNRTLLAKAKGDLTMASVAMGTPAYMPPEQARDASTVDHRADQYSLGCTLWYLLVGKAPYQGATAYEIITKHIEAPLPDVDEHIKNVPPSLKSVLTRMMAKAPEDRYADMSEVIRELEAVLGVDTEKGAYTPRERHLMALERVAASYYSAPFQKVRSLAVAAFFIGMPVAVAVLGIAGAYTLAIMALLMLVTTPIASVVTSGILTGNYLARRLRSVFFGMSFKGWANTVGGLALAVGLIAALGWWLPALLAILGGAGLAAGYQFGLLGKLRAQRQTAVDDLNGLLKELRLRGVPEEALMDFVCKFAGDHWEEMFEEVFGYEEMAHARGKTGSIDKVKRRKRFATWRDPLMKWLEGVEEKRKARREKAALAKAEAARLKAEGKSEKEAKKQADQAATKMLGDIKEVSAEQKKRKKAAAAEAAPRKALAQPGRGTTLDSVIRGAGGVIGLYVALTFISHMFSNVLPSEVQQLLKNLERVPLPTDVRATMLTWLGIGAGAGLLLGALSSWRLVSALTLVGGVFTIGASIIGPLVEGFGIPGLSRDLLPFVGLGLSGLGLLWGGYHKLGGSKF